MRMSAADFRKEFKITGGFVDARKRNNSKNSRSSGPVCQDNGDNETLLEAIQTLRSLQGRYPTDFYSSPIRLDIEIQSGTPADGDNIFKALADGLQGYAFENDKQIRQGSFRMRPGNGGGV